MKKIYITIILASLFLGTLVMLYNFNLTTVVASITCSTNCATLDWEDYYCYNGDSWLTWEDFFCDLGQCSLEDWGDMLDEVCSGTIPFCTDGRCAECEHDYHCNGWHDRTCSGDVVNYEICDDGECSLREEDCNDRNNCLGANPSPMYWDYTCEYGECEKDQVIYCNIPEYECVSAECVLA